MQAVQQVKQPVFLRGQFLRYAVPGILALLLNSAYVVVDGLFVARLIGREALAAVTIGVPVVEILIALSMLVAVGSGAVISASRGQGDAEKARRLFTQAARMMLILSGAIAVCGLLFHEQIGRLLGGTPEIMPLVKEYLLYLFLFSPFLLFSYGLSAWVRNDERPALALVAMGVGAATNILLDYVFIQWFHWGVAGAAIATGIGPVVSCCILAPHFLKKRGQLYFVRLPRGADGRLARKNGQKRILYSGIPAFLMEFSLGLTTLCVNLAVAKHMGAFGIAVFGVVGYVALLAMTVFLGMAEGSQPLYSFYHGQKEQSALRTLRRLAFVCASAIGLVFYGLVLLFADYPAAVFAGADVALAQASVRAMWLYFPAFFASGINIQASSFLQAVGRWKQSAIISALRSLVLLGALLVALPACFGAQALWLAPSGAELLTLPIAVLFSGRTAA